MRQMLVKIVAVLQIVVGALLLSGTVGLTTTAYRTVRDESEQLVVNLSAAASALESLRTTYEQSAANLFGLTGTMDGVSSKLTDVSEKLLRTGELFTYYGKKCEETALGRLFQPLAEWFRSPGDKLTDIGRDVASISRALKVQGETIKTYREDGHEKTLAVMSESVESLRHAIRMLDNGSSAARWCGFVCILGFCVSMLFFANGMLLVLFARDWCVHFSGTSARNAASPATQEA